VSGNAQARQPDEIYCRNCGLVIKTNVQFCRHCGAVVAAVPGVISAPSVRGARRSSLPFSSCEVLARFVVAALVLVIITDIAGVVCRIAELQLIDRMINGEFVTMDEAEASDDRQAVVGGFQLVFWVVTAILFLVWIYRAHRNLPALGASGLKYSPGWAVGGWFIPFLGLWRPYQVTAEIWKASDPDRNDPEGNAWQRAPVSPLLGFWWAFFLASGVIGWFVFRLAFRDPEDLHELRLRSLSFLAADLIGIAAAILAIIVVWDITSRQEEKSRRLQNASQQSVAALDVEASKRSQEA
jgi:hypothetical protein